MPWLGLRLLSRKNTFGRAPPKLSDGQQAAF
jgi:hypothetical protein